MITDRINSNLQALYNIEDPKYKALICDKDGTNPTTISKPTDIDLGVITSEIEYLRRLSIDLLKQMYIDEASGEFLKYQLEDFFASLQLEDETDVEWVQRTIATVFQQKVSNATIIYTLRPYSTLEPELSTIVQESAYADFSFADVYTANTFEEITTIVNDYDVWESALAAPEFDNWYSVAYGNGIFVAVGTGTTNRIMRSDDYGLTWTVITAPESNSWASITYGNGVFVAVASSGTNRTMRSTDYGLTWSPIVASEDNGWRAITYGNGIFVATSSSGTNRIMRSDDYGLTWTSILAPEANNWFSITYGNGVFVAVATSGTNRTMRSTDYGLTWSPIVASEDNVWYSVAYGNDIFVAVATTGTNRVMRSDDYGLTWTSILAPEANNWFSITYGNGVFVAVARSGTNRIMRSTDYGLNWSLTAAPGVNDSEWYSVTYGDGIFVSVATNGTNRSMHSFHSETVSSITINVLPAIAENSDSSFFTLKITLYNTTNADIWTVQNIIRKMIAAGISYVLQINYT